MHALHATSCTTNALGRSYLILRLFDVKSSASGELRKALGLPCVETPGLFANVGPKKICCCYGVFQEEACGGLYAVQRTFQHSLDLDFIIINQRHK